MSDKRHPSEKPMAVATTIRTDPGRVKVAGSAGAGITIPLAPVSGPGALLGRRYEIKRELGRGGEGAVYEAFDRHADELVALKIIEGIHEGSDDLVRLRRELGIARKVSHPGIVRLHDLVELDGRWALSMQLVDGASLEARIESRAPWSPEEVLLLATRLAEALAAAHEAGVVHRDLKPANVLLYADGRPVISDFGISRTQGTQPRIASSPGVGDLGLQRTREGALVGTPLYMSPEQLRMEAATRASDVYAFGLILYEVATGEVPLVGHDLPALAALRNESRAAPLATLRPDLAAGLAALVDRCLAPAATDRFADGAELVRALARIAKRNAAGDSPDSRATPSQPAHTGNRMPVALLGGLALSVVCGLALGVWLIRERRATDPSKELASATASPETPLQLTPTNHRRVTFGNGCEEFPTFVGGSQQLLFDATLGDQSHLFMLDLETGESEQITTSPGWDLAASPSPDGKSAVFLRYDDEKKSSFVVDLSPPYPVRFLVEGRVRPVFTTDGKFVWGGQSHLALRVDLQGNRLESLPAPPRAQFWNLIALPDNALIAGFPTYLEEAQRGLGVFSGEDRSYRPLSNDPLDEALALAPDGRHIVYTRVGPGQNELAAIPIAGGPSISLAHTNIQPFKGIAFSPDGKRVAWSTCRDYRQFVALDESDGPPPTSNSEDFDAAPLPDGKMALLSARDGRARPWIVDPGGSAPPRVVAIADQPSDIAASADGKRLLLATETGIQLVTLGEPPRVVQLTQGTRDTGPIFSHDEQTVVFSRIESDRSAILTMPILGGPVTDTGLSGSGLCRAPELGAVIYLSPTDSGVTLMHAQLANKTERPLFASLPRGRYSRPTVSPDGTRVAFSQRGTEMVVVDYSSGKVVKTYKKGGDQLNHAVFDSNGKLFAGRSQWVGDVWVADL